MELEDLIKQSIIEDYPIESIYESLSSCYNVGISPAICASLFIPIIQHAIRNKEVDKLTVTYSNVIASIYAYTSQEDITNTQVIFQESARLIKLISQVLRHSFITDDHEIKVKSIEAHVLINILAVLTKACSLILSENEGFYFDAELSIIWDTLPQIIKLCSSEFRPTDCIILKSTINICRISMTRYLVDYDDTTIYYMLIDILQIINKPNIPQDTQNALAETITFLIEFCPHLHFDNTSVLVNLLNSYASSIQSYNNPILLKSIFHLSCLLARHKVSTQWFSDDLIRKFKDSNNLDANIVDLLKEKHTSILNNSDEDTSVIAMDIDVEQPSVLARLNSTIAPDNVYDKVPDIISELTSSNERTERNQQLLSELKYVSTLMDNADLLILCQSYMKEITEFVTRILVIDPEFAENVTQLFGFQIPQFLSAFLEYALPYAITRMDSDDALSGISASLEINIKNLCKDGAVHILVQLLMESDVQVKKHGYKRLQQITKEKDIVEKLARENVTKITTTLAMNLGIPRLKQNALNGLIELKGLARNPKEDLSDYISAYFIAILERISRYISEKRDQLVYIQDPQALVALGEIMIILKSNIKDHTLHLMKVFETLNKQPGMQLKVLSLWKVFISLLDDELLRTLLISITKSLIDIMTVSNHDTRQAVAIVLEDLLIMKSFITPEDYANLPNIPDYQELSRLNSHVNSNRMIKSNSVQLRHDLQYILNAFSDFDTVKVLLGLQKLEKIMSMDNVDLGDFRDQLYSKLLYLIEKYGSHQQISYLAAVCVGKLGAVDPGIVKMKAVDDTVYVMNDYSRQDEKLAFICDLIINHIYPAYNAVNEVNVRLCMEYSIQTLLKNAGYRPMQEMKSKHTLVAIYTSWRKLPKSIQEFLTPFLQSAYHVSWSEQPLEYPIYTKAKSFQDWVQHWFCRMAKCAQSPAKEIFAACIPMVQSNLTDITLHLLPYIVLHVILSCTTDNVHGIVSELLLVFEANAKPADQSGIGKMGHYSLQVAVSITEYCRKWLNRVGLKDLAKKSQVSRVNRFLQAIPSMTMGIAAFHIKAYPHALMQLETHLKEKAEKMDPEIQKYLKQIYIQLDDPESLKGLMETYSSVLSVEEEIFRYESLGKWSEAEVLYRNKIQDNPSDISSYEGYMECLKKSGNYESLLYIADKEFANVPNLLPQINSFKIDSAWHLKDWNTLDKSVSLPMQKSFQAMVGCTLDHMLRQRHIDASCTIEEARLNIIEQIKMSSYRSYRRYYPLIFDLQLLQELEDSQVTWESSDPMAQLDRLKSVWNKSRKLMRPRSQYQTRLLELRKAAFFDVRDTTGLEESQSELWIHIAKENQKLGNMAVALNALNQAERVGGKSYYKEKAKWFAKNGFKMDAVRLIRSNNPRDVKQMDPYDALFISNLFLQEPVEGVNTSAYHGTSVRVGPDKLEKAYHNVCTLYTRSIQKTRGRISSRVRYQSDIVKFASLALQYGSKYYYSSMSRLINSYLEVATTKPEDDRNDVDIKKYIMKAHTLMHEAVQKVPAYQFSLFLTRLISHLSTSDETIAKNLTNCIGHVFLSYPRNTIWLLMGALDSHSMEVAARMNKILEKAQAQKSVQVTRIIQQATSLKRGLFELSEYPEKSPSKLDISLNPKLKMLRKFQDLDLYLPTEANMLPTLPEIISNNQSIKPFPDDSPTIRRLADEVIIMKSLQAPKKISFYGSDGHVYSFLLKKGDDLRKDARTMEFNYMINNFLKKNPDSRDCELYIRTYCVIPMGHKWGLIEWIDHLNPLKGIVNDYWEASGHSGINAIAGKYGKAALDLPEQKKQYFVTKIMPNCSSVFYKWFLDNFPDSTQWLNSRTRYVKTLAVMSIVGYLIGLGDRHAENILFDQTNGDCIHVDLNMLFGYGKTLPVPELVPFRLTHNLTGAMGITGTKGVFQKMCEVTLEVLRENKEPLLSVFQTYVNELESSEKLTMKTRPTNITSSTIIDSIERRFMMGEDVSATVRKLIDDATSTDNLSQMFVGWCPFV